MLVFTNEKEISTYKNEKDQQDAKVDLIHQNFTSHQQKKEQISRNDIISTMVLNCE